METQAYHAEISVSNDIKSTVSHTLSPLFSLLSATHTLSFVITHSSSNMCFLSVVLVVCVYQRLRSLFTPSTTLTL